MGKKNARSANKQKTHKRKQNKQKNKKKEIFSKIDKTVHNIIINGLSQNLEQIFNVEMYNGKQ